MDREIKFIVTADSSRLAADTDKAGRSLTLLGRNAKSASDEGTSAANSFSRSLTSLKTIAGGIGIAFGALKLGQMIGEGVSAAYEFQGAWTKVSVILRDTPSGQVEALKKEILGLDPALGSATELTNALYQAISSGVADPQQALILVKNAAVAAAGGFTSVETALKAGAAVMNAYGLSANESRQIFDVMAKTVDLGVISFEQLSSQIGQVVSIAAANKVSFEELTAATASLTLGGVQASEAITSVRAIINSMMKPSSESAEAAKRLGIQWNAAALEAHGLTWMLDQLANNSKVTTTDIAALTGRVEASSAVMALTSETGVKTLHDSLGTLKEASEGAGASMDSFKAQQATLTGELKTLGNTVVKAAESFGNFLAPALTAMVGVINQALSGIGKLIDKYKTIPTTTQDVIDKIKALEDKLSAQGIVIDKTGKSFQQYTDELVATDEALKSTSTKFDLFNTSTVKAGQGLHSVITLIADAKEEVHELTEEQKKLVKAFDESARPAATLAKKMKELVDAGVPLNRVIASHAAALVEARKREAENGEAADALTKKYWLLSMQVEQNKILGEALIKTTPRLTDGFEKVAEAAKKATKEIYFLNAINTETDKSFASLDKSFWDIGLTSEEVAASLGRAGEALHFIPEKYIKSGKDSKEGFLSQVSTIWTDFSKTFVGAIMGDTSIIDAFKSLGTALLRALVEALVAPLIAQLAGAITGFIGNLLGVSVGGVSTAGGLLGSLGSLGSAGGLLGGLFSGGGGAATATASSVYDIPALAGTTAEGGGILASIGGALAAIPVWGWAGIGAASLGVLFSKIFTKDAWEAGAMEAARDFGGVQYSEQAFKDFSKALGISESVAYGIRKDLMASPQMLANVLGPLAQAQGRMEEFLSSLQTVKTTWGTFNFREAFELGQATDDWSALNEAFIQAFGSSMALQSAVPNWASALIMPIKAATAAVDELGISLTNLPFNNPALNQGFSQAATGTSDFWAAVNAGARPITATTFMTTSPTSAATVKGSIYGYTPTQEELAATLANAFSWYHSSYQTLPGQSRYVRATGMAMVHEGETVSRPKAGSGGVTIVVNNNGPILANDVDRIVAASLKRLQGRQALRYL